MKHLFRPDDKDTLRVRRHIALACLLFNGGIVIGLMIAVFYGPPDRSSVIDEITEIVLSISILTGGFVGAWFHSAYKKDRNQGTPSNDG